jgi:membrane protein DedA with SNARE-associated domain
VTHFVENYGLWVVFIVVFLEVAGLPFIPGETAVIAAAALASSGHGSIVWTIALAIAAAIAGACTGYAIGRWRGRQLLSVHPRLQALTKDAVDRSERFFAAHGGKAVFLGRFVPVLRATLGWMAGVARMPLATFLVWCVAGAVAWGLAIGLASYYAGMAVIDAIQRDAGYAIAGLVVAAVVALVVRRRLHH